MECKASDSKKLLKVFDAPKKTRRKKNGLEESSDTDASRSVAVGQINSKPQLSADTPVRLALGKKNSSATGSSSGGASPSPPARLPPHRPPHGTPHSPRRRKGGKSLALKPACASPRAESQDNSPQRVQRPEAAAAEVVDGDKDAYIYGVLEEALKKKNLTAYRVHEEQDVLPDISKPHMVMGSIFRGTCLLRRPVGALQRELKYITDRHKSHRHELKSPAAESVPDRDSNRHRRHVRKDSSANRAELLETIVKVCLQAQDPPERKENPVEVSQNKSNKSLQCECMKEYSDRDRYPTRMRKGESPRELSGNQNLNREKHFDSRPSLNEPCRSRLEPNTLNTGRYTDPARHSQEIDLPASRSRDYLKPRIYDERPSNERLHERELRSRFYDERSSKDRYERNGDERRWAREEKHYRDIHYDDRRRRCEDRERYDRDYNSSYSPRRNPDGKSNGRYRDSGMREDRRCFEERESDISVIDAADSLICANAENERFESPANQIRNDCLSQKNRSNFCKESVVIDPAIQREVAEQREALDRMMKLWQELMSRFKDVAENMGRSERTVQETAAAARESAATQMQLWRECMQRYDTVARDVGDTDARLKDELQRQKAEMAEMSSGWQECLAHYKEISTDLTTIKQKISTEPPPPPPAPHYAPTPQYPPAPPADGYMLPPAHPAYPAMYGSPVRARASVPAAAGAPPPVWWWGGGGASSPPPRARRTPSLESRGERSRERRRRHRDSADRDHRSKDASDSKIHASRSDRRRKK